MKTYEHGASSYQASEAPWIASDRLDAERGSCREAQLLLNDTRRSHCENNEPLLSCNHLGDRVNKLSILVEGYVNRQKSSPALSEGECTGIKNFGYQGLTESDYSVAFRIHYIKRWMIKI